MAGTPGGNQRPWWEKEQPAPVPAAPRSRGVAYYRHSARDRQENSVAIQQELVQKWAGEHGVDIVHEFADRGKSGLTAAGRDGFNDMMENWVKKRKDFDFVLCLDVILVAGTDDTGIQNVLMDAFDQGIVNYSNFAKARALIGARMDKRKRRGANTQAGEYTVATLTHDITDAPQARDSYVREAQAKESRLFVLLDGLTTLWQDPGLLKLLTAEGFDKRPELSGTYNLAAA